MVQLVVERLPSARSPEVRISRRQLTARTGPSGTVPIEDSFVIDVSAARAKTLLARANPRFPSFAAKSKFIRQLQGEKQVEFVIGTAVSGEVAAGFGRERVKSPATKARQQREAEVRIQARRQKLAARAEPRAPRVERVKQAARERELFRELEIVRGTQITTLRQAPPIRDLVTEAEVTPIQRDTAGVPLGPQQPIIPTQVGFQESRLPQPKVKEGLFLQDKSITQKLEEQRQITQDVFEQSERERKFFEEENTRQFLKQTERLGSFLTLGKGKPVETRGFLGQTAERLVTGISQIPLTPAATVFGLQKETLRQRILKADIATRQQVRKEQARAFREVEATTLSGLPGGTPITSEGAAALLTAGLFAAAPAVAKVRGRRKARKVAVDISLAEGTRFIKPGEVVDLTVGRAKGLAADIQISADLAQVRKTIPSDDLFVSKTETGALVTIKEPGRPARKIKAKATGRGLAGDQSFIEFTKIFTPEKPVRRIAAGKTRPLGEGVSETFITRFDVRPKPEGEILRGVGVSREVVRPTPVEGVLAIETRGIGIGGEAGLAKVAERFDVSRAQSLVKETQDIFTSKRRRAKGRPTRRKPERRTGETLFEEPVQVSKPPAESLFKDIVETTVKQDIIAGSKRTARTLQRRGALVSAAITTTPRTRTGIVAAQRQKPKQAAAQRQRGIQILDDPQIFEPGRQQPRQAQKPAIAIDFLSGQEQRQTPLFPTPPSRGRGITDFDNLFKPQRVIPLIPPILLFPKGKPGKKRKIKAKKVKGFKPGLKALAFNIRSELTSKELEQRLREQRGFGARPLPKKRKKKFSKQAKRLANIF